MDIITYSKLNKAIARIEALEEGGVPAPETQPTEVTEVTNVAPAKPLKDVCLYYGYPSGFSNDWENENCALKFSKYDILVLGDGYEKNSHEDHANTVEIVQKTRQYNPEIEIFGYIPIGTYGVGADSNRSIATIKADIDDWIATGATGVFLDEFGFDYKVTRDRQNEIIDYAHGAGINVFANPWQVDYAFTKSNMYLDWMNYYGNPNQLKSTLGEDDYLLFENMFYEVEGTTQKVSGIHTDWGEVQQRIYESLNYYEKVDPDFGKTYYEEYGTKVIALDAVLSTQPLATREKQFMNGYLGSLILNLDGYCASREDWASMGGYDFYNHPSFIDLAKQHKHHVKLDDPNGNGYYTRFTAEVGMNTLVLDWEQGADFTVATGTHKVSWNGTDVTSIPNSF